MTACVRVCVRLHVWEKRMNFRLNQKELPYRVLAFNLTQPPTHIHTHTHFHSLFLNVHLLSSLGVVLFPPSRGFSPALFLFPALSLPLIPFSDSRAKPASSHRCLAAPYLASARHFQLQLNIVLPSLPAAWKRPPFCVEKNRATCSAASQQSRWQMQRLWWRWLRGIIYLPDFLESSQKKREKKKKEKRVNHLMPNRFLASSTCAFQAHF